MQIEYNREWLGPTIEIIKCLDDVGEPSRNEELDSIDYIVDNGGSKKLIRVMVNENNGVAPLSVNTIRATIEELDENKFVEAMILSKRLTSSAHDLVTGQDNLVVKTPTKHCFSLTELIVGTHNKIEDLCKMICGKAPVTKDDCKGKEEGKYVCDVRRQSDDVTFHARMKWIDPLLQDFNNLCNIEKKIIKQRTIQK